MANVVPTHLSIKNKEHIYVFIHICIYIQIYATLILLPFLNPTQTFFLIEFKDKI